MTHGGGGWSLKWSKNCQVFFKLTQFYNQFISVVIVVSDLLMTASANDCRKKNILN